MDELEISGKSPANATVLNNSGGAGSRNRTEKISSSIFDKKNLKSHNETHCLAVPSDVDEIECWLIEIAQQIGWISLKEAILKLELPEERLLVIPCGPVPKGNRATLRSLLRSALILSKCNQNYYHTDAPMIFTRNRLHRNVELIKINMNAFYELD